MSQLPGIPPVQGAKSLARPAEAATAHQALDSADPAENAPFIAAMQEVVDAQESELLPELGWTMALPVEPLMTSMPVLSGTLMPDQPAAGGKHLPLQFTAAVSAQSAVIKPVALPEPCNGLLAAKLIGQVDGANLSSAIAASAEEMLQVVDARSGGELTSQAGLTGLQTLNGALQGRSVHLSLPIDVPVAQPGWDKAVGERIQWMLGRNIQHAEIKLTPPNLGPMEIRISVQNDQASVSFIAAQSLTREALEASLPRLREMFGDANLNLVDVGVGQGGGSDSNNRSGADAEDAAYAGVESSLPDNQSNTLTRYASDGLVDDYA